MEHALVFDKILYFPKKINHNEYDFQNDYTCIRLDDINNAIIRYEKDGEMIGEGFIYKYQGNEYITVYNDFGVLQLINLKDRFNIYSYSEIKKMSFKKNTLKNEEYQFILENRLLTLFYKILIDNEEYASNKLFNINPSYSLYLKKHVFTYKGRNIYEYDLYKIDDEYYVFLIIRNNKKKITYSSLDIDYLSFSLTNKKENNDKLYIRYFNQYNKNTDIKDIHKASKIEYITNLAVEMLNNNEEYKEFINTLQYQFKDIDLFFYK